MSEKRENPVGYRPSESVKKLFQDLCGEKSIISRSQIIEVAMQYLMMNTQEEIERIIGRFLTGKFDDHERESHQKTQKKMA